MKKYAIVLLVSIVLISMLSTGVFAQAETAVGYELYDSYKVYCENYKDRTQGTQNELLAGYYLMRQLSKLGYTAVDGTTSQINSTENPYVQSFTDKIEDIDKTTNKSSYKNLSSANIVGYKRSAKQSAKLLVIGCAYGNLYAMLDANEKPIENEAAYENSSAVATLLGIAKDLSTVNNLDFDVAIAFFGADAYSCLGAQNFVKNNKQEILGYINLSAVAGGDNLYAFYDDVPTAHGKLIDGIIDKFGYGFTKVPYDKKVLDVSADGDERPYFHIGLNSANYVFLEAGIPSVNIFGYNWSVGSESEKYANVIGTKNDSYQYMEEKYGKEKINDRLLTAKNLVVNTVIRNGELAESLEEYDNSYTKLYSNATYYAVLFSCIGVVIVLFVVGAVLTNKRTLAAGNPDFSTNSKFLNGENDENANSEDIFGMHDGEQTNVEIIGDKKDIDTTEENKSSSDNVSDDDDIFGEF